MQEYYVVEASNREKLVRDVNYRLSCGWRCTGGVAVSYLEYKSTYAQALVRTKDDGNDGEKLA